MGERDSHCLTTMSYHLCINKLIGWFGCLLLFFYIELGEENFSLDLDYLSSVIETLIGTDFSLQSSSRKTSLAEA